MPASISNAAFVPWVTGTVNIATPAAAGSNVALPTLGATPGGPVTCNQVQIYNGTNMTVFVAHGTSSAIAASITTDMPVPAGAVIVIGVLQSTTYMAAKVASGTATGAIYFTCGEGI